MITREQLTAFAGEPATATFEKFRLDDKVLRRPITRLPESVFKAVTGRAAESAAVGPRFGSSSLVSDVSTVETSAAHKHKKGRKTTGFPAFLASGQGRD
jgi:hypothetical protein